MQLRFAVACGSVLLSNFREFPWQRAGSQQKKITPLQNDPQQLRFWAMRNFPIYPFERISIGMLRQYPPWPKNKACERFSATE